MRSATRGRAETAPPIRQPKTDLTPGPGGLWFAVCRRCPWTAGPSVKTYIGERAMAHRGDHRAGRVPFEVPGPTGQAMG